jgi:hypothetical protein
VVVFEPQKAQNGILMNTDIFCAFCVVAFVPFVAQSS